MSAWTIVLLASGLIVGESLFGVFFAGVIVSTGKESPFGIFPVDWPFAMILGVVVFAALVVGLYRWIRTVSVKVAG